MTKNPLEKLAGADATGGWRDAIRTIVTLAIVLMAAGFAITLLKGLWVLF